MTGYDNWDDERARLLHGLGEETVARVGAALDAAAAAARGGNLREAARRLEDARAPLVAMSHFRRVDDDILCFSSLIGLIRRMSSEERVPSEYQRFVAAIPNLRIGEDMTPAQKAFWYGASNAQVGGQIRMVGEPGSANDMSQVVISGIVLAAIVAAWYFFS